jgi:hypothetical protein
VLGQVALAQEIHVLDQFADRLDQVAIDQPQAQQGDQQARKQHDQRAPDDGLTALFTDFQGTGVSQLAQVDDQACQLFAGHAVDAGHGLVAQDGIGTAGQESVAALAIGQAQFGVLATQALDSLANFDRNRRQTVER